MNDHALDQLVAAELRATYDEQSEVDALSRIGDRLSSRLHPDLATRKRPRRILLRSVSIAMAATIALVAVSAGAPAKLARIFGDSKDDAANKMSVFQAEKEPTPTEMSVFEASDKSDLTDEMTKSAITVMKTLPLPGGAEPAPLLDPKYLRTLVTLDERQFNFRLLAIPTSAGEICVLKITDATSVVGSCTDRLGPGMPITAGFGAAEGEPIVLAGLASDSVESVVVVSDGGVSGLAKLGSNGYVWRAPSAEVTPVKLLVHLRGGKVVTVPAAG